LQCGRWLRQPRRHEPLPDTTSIARTTLMFVVCGEALWDLFAVEGDPLAFQARPGGSPFNVAVGLARLGQRTALLAGLSTDPLGQRLERRLRADGVATTFLLRSARPTTISLVDLAPDGAPAYAFYGDDGADRVVTPADLPRLGPEVWGLHAGSYSLAVEPVGAALLDLFTRESRRLLLTLDPNVRLAVQPDAALWRRRVDAFVRLADLVKLSDEDLRLLRPGADPSALASEWLRAGAGLVVLTRGAAGAEAFSAAGRVTVPGRPVSITDTVGDGDAFQAALIAGLAERGIRDRRALAALDREVIADLLAFANAAGAIACTRQGADLPRRVDLPPLLMEVS
jgi:fructokinase